MSVADEIMAYLVDEAGARADSKGQGGEAKLLIAEQKSFLSKKKVEYSARFKVDDGERTSASSRCSRSRARACPAATRWTWAVAGA